jgi:hypothetical protein
MILCQTWAREPRPPARRLKSLASLDATRQTLDERCYSEPEAAAWLGVAPHVLRDERLRGRITASRIVGSRIRYMRGDLIAYVMGRRAEGGRR